MPSCDGPSRNFIVYGGSVILCMSREAVPGLGVLGRKYSSCHVPVEREHAQAWSDAVQLCCGIRLQSLEMDVAFHGSRFLEYTRAISMRHTCLPLKWSYGRLMEVKVLGHRCKVGKGMEVRHGHRFSPDPLFTPHTLPAPTVLSSFTTHTIDNGRLPSTLRASSMQLSAYKISRPQMPTIR